MMGGSSSLRQAKPWKYAHLFSEHGLLNRVAESSAVRSQAAIVGAWNYGDPF